MPAELTTASTPPNHPELLVDASGLDAAAVDASLREALATNVVRQVGSHLDFRHGLLREAVYGDLMPGERAQAHRLLAEAAERTAGAAGPPPLLGVGGVACRTGPRPPAGAQGDLGGGEGPRTAGLRQGGSRPRVCRLLTT